MIRNSRIIMLLFFSIISFVSARNTIYADTENTINIHYKAVEDKQYNDLSYRLWNITDHTPINELNKKTVEELDNNYQYIDSGQNNINGIVTVNNIPNGHYYIRAKEIPNIVPILIELPLKNDSKTVEIYSKDYIQTGSIILKKIGIDNKNRELRLQGVKFKLYSEDGLEVRFKKNIPSTDIDSDAILITDKEGIIKINSILPGIYYFKEIKTLPNYNLKEEKIEIKVESNKISEVKVINEMKNSTSTKKGNIIQRYFPKTGSKASFFSVILGILILICLYILRRKKNKRANNE